MSGLLNIALDLSLKCYLSRNPEQLLPIERLDHAPESILVISSTALGDTLLSTPAIKSLKRSLPQSRITLLVGQNIAPLFAGFPYLDRTVIYYGGYKRFYSTVAALRAAKPEVVLILHGNGPQDIAFAIFSGARHILKHPAKSPDRRYLIHHFEQKYQHTIEDRLDMVRKLGCIASDRTMEIPRLDDSLLAAAVGDDLGGNGEYVGFQVGASHSYNMWPIENFTMLAERILAADADVRIVVTGLEREKALGESIVRTCGCRVLNLCGRYSVAELPYLIRRFRLLVTGDTGPMHLAIALKVPTLSLFSSADPNVTGAYQDLDIHRIIQKDGSYIRSLPKKKRDDGPMRLITVDEVFAAYEDIMRNRPV